MFHLEALIKAEVFQRKEDSLSPEIPSNASKTLTLMSPATKLVSLATETCRAWVFQLNDCMHRNIT